MKSQWLITFIAIAFLSLNCMAQLRPKAGDKAPDFTGTDQDGKKIVLSKFKGKKVILYFYPKDNTPGCTAQACNLRDNSEALLKKGYTIIGVSTDDETSHKDFIKNYSLPFSLIADKDHLINEAYGVWVEKERDGKKFWGTARVTFVINEKGMVEKVIDQVSTSQHAEQILN